MSRSSPALSFPSSDDDNNDDIVCQAEEDQRDHDAFHTAAEACLNGASAGTILGVGLAEYLTERRTRLFEAFKIDEQPVAVVLRNGRTERLPDLAPFVRVSKWGSVATFGACVVGGALVGVSTGWWMGMSGGWRRDHEARLRTARGMAKHWADVARKKEGGQAGRGKGDKESFWDDDGEKDG